MVGVNRFTVEQEKGVRCSASTSSGAQAGGAAACVARATRPGPWKEALGQVEEAARSGSNLMPYIVRAVEAFATVGEISDTLRKVMESTRRRW